MTNFSLNKFIKNYYNNQEKSYLGITNNAISRESEIPQSTTKSSVGKLISKKLVTRNRNQLIIPIAKVRDMIRFYPQYCFVSKKNFNIFNELDLKKKY